MISNGECGRNNKRGIKREKGNNFKKKLHGIFQNFLLMNNFYVSNISPRYKKAWFIAWLLLPRINVVFLLVLIRAKQKGKYQHKCIMKRETQS